MNQWNWIWQTFFCGDIPRRKGKYGACWSLISGACFLCNWRGSTIKGLAHFGDPTAPTQCTAPNILFKSPFSANIIFSVDCALASSSLQELQLVQYLHQGDINFGASSQAHFSLNYFLSNFLANFLTIRLKFFISPQLSWHAGTINVTLNCTLLLEKKQCHTFVGRSLFRSQTPPVVLKLQVSNIFGVDIVFVQFANFK